jgi:putative ABC transport system permease protein
MIKQFFKLIWNRKRTNFLMISGIFVSFLALSLVATSIFYALFNYAKPLGFNYEDVWVLNMDWKNLSPESVGKTLAQIENTLESTKEIKSHALSANYIFQPMVYSGMDYFYEGKKLPCFLGEAGPGFCEVLDIEMIEGKWFDESDRAGHRTPLVINTDFKDKFSPHENAVGKILTDDDKDEYEIIGVIGEFRRSGELAGSESAVFRKSSYHDEKSLRKLASDNWYRILFKVEEGASVTFEARLLNRLKSIARGWTLRMDTLDKARKRAFKTTLILPVILTVVCGFLTINVALGLFGIIWYSTNRRKAEIGLRRALGANSRTIYAQIIGETLALATVGIAAGCFLAFQFPILDVIGFIEDRVYYFAYAFSIIGIYIISAFCALYPAWLAARIQPADALRNE